MEKATEVSAEMLAEMLSDTDATVVVEAAVELISAVVSWALSQRPSATHVESEGQPLSPRQYAGALASWMLAHSSRHRMLSRLHHSRLRCRQPRSCTWSRNHRHRRRSMSGLHQDSSPCCTSAKTPDSTTHLLCSCLLQDSRSRRHTGSCPLVLVHHIGIEHAYAVRFVQWTAVHAVRTLHPGLR